MEFPRENIRFVEKLGDCQFGEVRSKISNYSNYQDYFEQVKSAVK